MHHQLQGLLHASLVITLHRLSTEARREDGQGTVEYVGLLVLLGALFAGVVAVAGKANGSGIGELIVDQVKDAIGKVTKN